MTCPTPHPILSRYLGYTYRKLMVKKYKQQGVELTWEGDMHEYCCWAWCTPCTLCQEHRTAMSYVDYAGNWNVQQGIVQPAVLPQPVGMPMQATTAQVVQVQGQVTGQTIPTKTS